MSHPDQERIKRLGGLRRFAAAITVLNLLGHTFLGFEQSHAQPLCSLLTAYACELFLEWVDSSANHCKPRFRGHGFMGLVDFLLPAHITGLAIGMLLYANDRLLPFAFAAGAAICSKYLFRSTAGKGGRHFFNPSNLGITATLLIFPYIGIAPPYMFTEGLNPVGSVILPLILITSGTLLNAKFTGRIPLLSAWAAGFVVQALIRAAFDTAPVFSILDAMSGVAFILFTFYMVTDPGSTPSNKRSQVIFGSSVALGYGLLVSMHVVFGMFFSLTCVCACRGALLAYSVHRERVILKERSHELASAGRVSMAR